MNKFRLLLTVIVLALLGACTDIDELGNIDNGQTQNQKISISVSVDDGISTRAGIVEGKSDYASGEEFYWSEGDEIRLYFVKDGGSGEVIPNALFEAENVNGNTADFTGTIPNGLNGTYHIYAAKDLEQTSPSSTQLKGLLPQNQTQTGKSSNGIVLPMLSSPIQSVQIVNGALIGNQSLDFNLKQLNSLLRFTLENNTSQAMTIEKIVISVEDSEGKPVNAFANGATIEMGTGADIEWNNIDSPLSSQLTLEVVQNGTEASIAEGAKFDAYLSVLPSEGLTVGNSFVVEVDLKGADGKNYLQKKKLTIANNGNFAFLSSGLEAGLRYYFINGLTDDNTHRISVVTFEDAPGSTYWSSLIDSPQYGGPLLYGDYNSVDYEWVDNESGLLSGTYGKVYWSGGLAISNYTSLDYQAYGSHLEQLTLYGTSGNNGSSNFAVSFGYLDDSGFTSPEWQPKMNFTDGAKTIDHMYIAPTCYFYNVAVNGNELSPAVGDDDVWLTATGYLGGVKGVTLTNYMIKDGISLINSWTKWDLSGLGKVDEVIFNIGGGTDNGYGFSLPAYFAIDDIMVIHN